MYMYGYDTDESEIGSFNLGRSVYVTDPAYQPDVWCCNKVEGFVPGRYNAYVLKGPEEGRIAEFSIYHSDYDRDKRKRKMVWEETPLDIGVDSAQAGFFSKTYYEVSKEKEKSYTGRGFGMPGEVYDSCCRITLDKKAGILDNELGAVSCTGYGDGVYDLYVVRDGSEQIIAAKIVFIYPSGEEDDEDEEVDNE